MKLVSIDTVRARIGEMNISDINELIGSAIDFVTVPIQTMLNTRFEYGTYRDVYLPRPSDPVKSVRPYKLALSSGLIDTGETFVVGIADTFEGLDSAIPMTVGSYIVNTLDGYVNFPNGKPANFIKIEFTSGLPVITPEPTLEDPEPASYYDESKIPGWLQTIAIGCSQSVYERLLDDRAKDRTNKKYKAEAQRTFMSAIPTDIVSIIDPRIRWYPDSYEPSYTETIV